VTSERLYVYGVVPVAEQEALAAAGVDGSKVELVAHGGLAALTSRVTGDTLQAARELRAHWQVLQQACEASTVVPMRFGTILEDEQAVRDDLLGANAEHLTGLLEQLRGCVQMTVKGSYVEDQLLRDIVASSQALSTLAAHVRGKPAAAAYYDRIQLGEGIAAAVAQRREHDTQRALAILEPAAEAARAEEAPGALDAFNLAVLVKRTRQDELGGRVGDLAGEFDGQVEIRYVGPLPPYSFAEGELVAAGGV
jgi:hypothetical protein